MTVLRITSYVRRLKDRPVFRPQPPRLVLQQSCSRCLGVVCVLMGRQ